MANIREVLIVAVILCSSIRAQFAPPVRTPNDCNRCVTTPCPCDTSCPELDCPINCERWQLDKRNCSTCDCECPREKCGLYCPYGYKTDKSGCETGCKCKCPEVKCGLYCPYGYKTDEFGCETGCECKCSPNGPCAGIRCASNTWPKVIRRKKGCPKCKCVLECPKYKCVPCPNGYKIDEDGCQTCECVPTEKAGSCPVAPEGMIGICTAQCTTDADCNGKRKCCGNCPRKCTKPVPPRAGKCPKEKDPNGKRCTKKPSCQNDESCPDKEKCCGTCRPMCKTPKPKWRSL